MSTPKAFISLKALGHNYSYLSSCASGAVLYAVLKANAYGHGALPCAEALYAQGCRHFAVCCAEEAAEIAPLFPCASDVNGFAQATLPSGILILSPVEKTDIFTLYPYKVNYSLHSLSYAKLLNAAVKEGVAKGVFSPRFRLPVQIKTDTGLSRLGFSSMAALLSVFSLPHLSVVGIYSHFGSADDLSSVRTSTQALSFANIRAALPHIPAHICASAALLRFGSMGCAAARTGIALYGISPLETPIAALSPVMTLTAPVLQVRTLRAGAPLGYGDLRLPHTTRVAVIGIGYADGLSHRMQGARISVPVRLWSGKDGKGFALCPLIGRICMDRAFVDIGDVPLHVGDDVTVFGTCTGDAERFASEGARTMAGTPLSVYALPTTIGARVKRIYI